MLWIKTVDAAAVTFGTAVTVNGTNYTVASVEPDGDSTGVTRWFSRRRDGQGDKVSCGHPAAPYEAPGARCRSGSAGDGPGAEPRDGASKTAIVREVGERDTITAKRLKRRVRFERIDQARMDRMKSRVFVVLTKMPVSYFGSVRQTKAGAKVRGKLYPGAFKAKMSSGHVGVFYRSGPRRFPIKQVKERLSSDLSWISRRVVQTTGVETYERRLTHELDRVKVWFEGKQA